jgi:hypothetical protein
MEDPDVQAEIKNNERSILAHKVIQKAYSELIKISPGDLKTYYEAHKEEYQKQQKAFADVQNEVYAALRTQKEQEVREYVLSQLKDKYDVVIHTSVMKKDGKDSVASDDENSKNKIK